MKALTSFGVGRARPRKRRGALEDLVGSAQLAVLALQRLQALALVSAQQLRPLALIGFGLTHPFAQRLVVDAEVARYVGDGATGLEDHPGTALQQLFGVLPLSCHGLIGSLPPGGILAWRSPSNPAWLTGDN